jgi:hypothetical protein
MPDPAELQRRLGNRGTQAWIRMQTKLTVSQPSDRYEGEADAAAERVVEGKLAPPISRLTASEEGRSALLRQPARERATVISGLKTAIQTGRGAGQALPTRKFKPVSENVID